MPTPPQTALLLLPPFQAPSPEEHPPASVGIAWKIELCGPAATASSGTIEIGSIRFFLLNQPNSPPSSVVLSTFEPESL